MWIHGSQSWSPMQLVQRLANIQQQLREEWKDNPLSPPNSEDEIGPSDRDRSVRWLMQVTRHLSFYPDTFFLAVHILDRFITQVKAHPKYLRCISITCLYLASKITEEEDVIPCTGELVESSGCGFRVRDVLRMERIILEKLAWNISASTSLQFLHVFHALTSPASDDKKSAGPQQHNSSQHRLAILTNILTAMTCHYPATHRFSAPVLALAVISLELESQGGDPSVWLGVTGKLQALAKLRTDDVMKCRMEVRRHAPVLRVTSSQNSAYVVRVSADERGGDAMKKVECGVSVKRKASYCHMNDDDDDVKKIHSSFEDDDDDVMEHSSSELATPELDSASARTPPTYAEIVKGMRKKKLEVSPPPLVFPSFVTGNPEPAATRCA